ncbi:beta-lactamase class A [Murinocardiopsis flavida]|uniref:Beta-lactamase n=1 Tax=Murinocardiopsis flavida TaxID=645275 RepID=A0A2P8CF33_9ACTN|nr:class A beta-lactamase [Murinocardiopsis flavida]PSK83571.1 beta-lactamase class A [Murinocardiopsis flavida]
MPTQLSRRTGLAALAVLTLVPIGGCATADEARPAASQSTTAAPASADREFKELEGEFDARLGVYAIDTGSDRTLSYQEDERFAYCSTHKSLSVGAVLEQNSLKEMEKLITYTEEDLVAYSPITEKHVDEGMTLRAVSDAAVRYSDNTAANLLFEELGGTNGFGDALKGIGDDVTDVSRIEPDLSEGTPGDVRDTSTPQQMATDLREYTLGDTLSTKKRAILTDLLVRNTTGDELIRAGVPDGWKVGDKTGSGGYGTRNDIAVIWPPEDDPIVLAIMSSRDTKDAESDDKLIAESAEVAIDALTGK